MPPSPQVPVVSSQPSQFSNEHSRPQVRGKFIYAGTDKLYIRGVTYGPFCPDENGNEYGDPELVARDFAAIAANGFNTIRTYTAPSRWFLDLAWQYGLRVMVGLAWEQHITFLDDRGRKTKIRNRLRAAVRSCAGHPAILCYAIGNEIPASIVRWYGAPRIERFLRNLHRALKPADPAALFTYVNYPSTEYLNLPFLDFVCFNVYLERRDRLDSYLARLQNLTDDRPLLITEIGLDSRRHGEEAQARSLDWQIRTVFANGCAGAFAFAWTDEWHRGGFEIEDWDFGLVTRERRPKPALAATSKAFAETPFPPDTNWPRISVVVCSYNGARTIRECFEGLRGLKYPNYEVIVVNDGSKDRTAAITKEYGFHLINTENRGLSSARNTGAEAAAGEIVAYIDDDAYPDPQWLTYLAATFMSTGHVAVGGPNIPPPGDGLIADCVANAPGGPIHVLLSDREAEHIPGCNMAFRKWALQAIGGFDPQFRTAGDDVDVCWRLMENGWTIGFNPAAMVWHHRRNSVLTYWKQQVGYGRAEALLEAKWPEKYNEVGHLTWAGRLYGKGLTKMLGSHRRIYHGEWGSALFQSVYEPASHALWSLPLMPEWYLLTVVLGLVSAFGFASKSLLLFTPLFLLAAAMPVVQALRSAADATFTSAPRTVWQKLGLRTLTAALHLIQPLARLRGRLRHGLTPWRRFSQWRLAPPWPRAFNIWAERWQSHEERLRSVESAVRAHRALVLRGGDFDPWDLEVRAGVLTAVRMRMAVEEHGGGKQLLRFRIWPRWSKSWTLLAFAFAVLSALAAFDQAWFVTAGFALLAVFLMGRLSLGCATAMAVLQDVLIQARTAEVHSVVTAAPVFQPLQYEGNGNGNGRGYPTRKDYTIAREHHGHAAKDAPAGLKSLTTEAKVRKASA
ncbi:MAG TPA: glycosyltransferase [Pyrinomonadaceae bacterium]